MRLLISLSEWMRYLRGQRYRTTSTLMGIGWGTFAVVGMLAFGTGLEELMRERAEGFGRGVVIVWPQRTTISFGGLPEGRYLRLTPDDVFALKREIPELEAVSPENYHLERVQRGERVFSVQISGVYPQWGDMRSSYPRPGGRFLNQADIDDTRRVMFLGDRIARQLFDEEDPVGRRVVLAGAPFTVVGVLRAKLQDSDYGGTDDMRICIPATTYFRIFGDRFVELFVFRAIEDGLVPQATRRVYEVLGRRLTFDPSDSEALQVWDTTQGDEVRYYAFLGMNLMMGLSGVLTLLVGGIGVGNLMFLIVSQRTAEIGVQMALGSRPSWVLQEVLAQALVLVAVGGGGGFLAAWGLAEVVGASPLVESLGRPRISVAVGGGTVLLLAAVGLAAGYFPARRAARLDPVRALAE